VTVRRRLRERLTKQQARATHEAVRKQVVAALVVRAVLLPVIIALAIFFSYESISDLRDIVPAWVVVTLLCVGVGFRMLRLVVLLWLEFGQNASLLLGQRHRAEPLPPVVGSRMLVLTGEVLRRSEAEGDGLFWLLVGINSRWLDVDVRDARIVTANGEEVAVPGLLGPHRLTAARGIYRLARERQQLELHCTPGGRALRARAA
jgi:hypothetical protein